MVDGGPQRDQSQSLLSNLVALRHSVGERTNEGLAVDIARAREPGRGRDAATPGDIPARGWNDILWRVFWSLGKDRVLSTAGGVAFFALLAVFPAVSAVVSLYGLFADASTMWQSNGPSACLTNRSPHREESHWSLRKIQTKTGT